jgi:hypothetical protein
MTSDQAVLFLQALGVQNAKPKGNGWVEGSCPLAPWTHKSGKDTNPSFGLKIDEGNRSHFSCFACRSGSAEELVHVLEMYSKDTNHAYDFTTAHKLLEDELAVLPLPEYEEFGSSKSSVFEEWPSYWLEMFAPVAYASAAVEYLQNRDVSPDMAAVYNLRFDPKREMIVAPYYTVFGQFAGARGRSIKPDTTYKHHDYKWNGKNNCRMVWYNEQVLNLPGPVVVVEGQFDCLKVLQVYQKVLANLTARPTEEKFKKLADCSKIVQIPDNDDAGEQSIEVYKKFAKLIGVRHTVLKLDSSVKDPSECHPNYLKELLSNVL